MRIIPGEGVQDVLLHVSVLLRWEGLREDVGELSRRVAVLDVHDLRQAPLADRCGASSTMTQTRKTT